MHIFSLTGCEFGLGKVSVWINMFDNQLRLYTRHYMIATSVKPYLLFTSFLEIFVFIWVVVVMVLIGVFFCMLQIRSFGVTFFS